MGRPKPVTPYQRLHRAANEYASEVTYPRRRNIWTIPKDRLDAGWHLSWLKERALAADVLGYDVVLRPDADGGLTFQFVKKRPEKPWEFA